MKTIYIKYGGDQYLYKVRSDREVISIQSFIYGDLNPMGRRFVEARKLIKKLLKKL